MKPRRRRGPSSPEALALGRAKERLDDADPSRWGVNAPSLSLGANAEVEASRGPRGEVTRARRQDLFDRLAARGALSRPALEAVRRLQGELAILHRTGLGVSAYAPRVDGRGEAGAVGDARLEAGRRIEAVLSLTGAASARLIRALCEGDAVRGEAGAWRRVVASETGERLADAQGAVIRAAAENLAAAYLALTLARRAARAA